MKTFFLILRAELIKYKSKASLFFLFLPLLLALQMWLQMRHLTSVDPSRGTWSMFMQMTCAFWGVFLFTPFVIFWSTHMMAMEREQWKKLLIQGISRYELLAGKILVFFGFIFLQTALLLGAVFLFGSSMNLVGSFPTDRMLTIFQAAIAIWPVIAVQCCLATFLRGYLLAIIPALMGHFASILGIQFAAGRYFPWSFSLEFLQIRGSEAYTHISYFLISLSMGFVLTLLAMYRLKPRSH